MKPWSRRKKFGAGLAGFLVAVLISIDQLGNTLLGGDPDTTISTRCGLELASDDPGLFCRVTCWGLDLIDTDHCPEARE